MASNAEKKAARKEKREVIEKCRGCGREPRPELVLQDLYSVKCSIYCGYAGPARRTRRSAVALHNRIMRGE